MTVNNSSCKCCNFLAATDVKVEVQMMAYLVCSKYNCNAEVGKIEVRCSLQQFEPVGNPITVGTQDNSRFIRLHLR